MNYKKREVSRQDIALPGSITKLATQKNTSDRVSIFIDGQFLIGVPEQVIIDLNLKVGSSIDETIYQQLLQEDEASKLEFYLLSLLSKRLYASSELEQKGVLKGYSHETIQKVLAKFERLDWINDDRFARAFASDKLRFQRWGPVKIRTALIQKKIERKFIERALDDLLTKDQEYAILKQLVIKRKQKFLREENILKRKKKILDFLLQKGFPSDIIYEQLDHFLALLDE